MLTVGAPSIRDDARLALGKGLRAAGYSFITPTPTTMTRVNRRSEGAPARDLRDVFGWNRPFEPDLLAGPLLDALRVANALDDTGRLWRSRLRASTLGQALYLHSGHPTTALDAVFFGPDSYRFARFIVAELQAMSRPPRRILDIGCGTGVGGLSLLTVLRGDAELVLADISPNALSLAHVNAQIAGWTDVRAVLSDVMSDVDGHFDLIVANPPYMMDPLQRTYRDGGGLNGAALSLRILREALPRLAPGGRLAIYTGIGIAAGRDQFHAAALDLLAAIAADVRYEEIDPDVFGEELEAPNYRTIERIAVVGLTVTS